MWPDKLAQHKATTRPTVQTKEGSKSGSSSKTVRRIDLDAERYPFCIVWTPLPVVSWFLPLIGHTGVADSKGIIYDFSDDLEVSRDRFSFGEPTKYYQFELGLIRPTANLSAAQTWDAAIREASDYYGRTRHSFCFNNCHQYIAAVLSKVHYGQRSHWDQYEVWSMITYRSAYSRGFMSFLRQWGPFAAILTIAILILILMLLL